MRYAIISEEIAKEYGINTIGHNKIGANVIVNEEELTIINNDAEEVAKALGCKLMPVSEIKKHLKSNQ